MIERIKTHNYLNGQIFSFLEYLFAAGVFAPFLAYYLIHSRWLYAILAIGVVLNCLTVCTFALVSMLRKERSIGILKISRDKELRRKVQHDHPDLTRQTMVLSLTVLVPFWIFAATLLDRRGRVR